MKIITKYMILKKDDRQHLESQIETLISDSSAAWQPFGNLQCVYDQGEKKVIYIQAMVGGK